MPLPRPLRIIIPGGTGYLGVLLARHFPEQGHSVSTVTRFPKPSDWEAIHWDAENLGDWAASFEGADVVINLAGQSANCRYTKANQRVIARSRIRTTELVGEAISRCSHPPRLWLNASSIDIYPDTGELPHSEVFNERTPPQLQFSAELARAWESAVLTCATPGTRKVLLRLAPVMSPDAGKAFDIHLRFVRWGLGGEIGSGEQYVAWIHHLDFIRAVEFLIEQEDIEGAVNLTAPVALPNHEFMCNLRHSWSANYFGLPAPTWLVKLTSLLIRTEPERVLKSRRVVPQRLLAAGFPFHFPEWRGACDNLAERWRILHSV